MRKLVSRPKHPYSFKQGSALVFGASARFKYLISLILSKDDRMRFRKVVMAAGHTLGAYELYEHI